MSVLVLAESKKGEFKKSSFELVHYGHLTATVLGTECIALVLGEAGDAGVLGTYGASKVIHINDAKLNQVNSQTYNSVIAQVASQIGADTVILGHSSTGKTLVGGLAVKMDAGSVSSVNAVPTNDGSFKVTKGVFAGKAIVENEIASTNRVLTLSGNSIPPQEVGAPVAVESATVEIPASTVTSIETKTVDGIVPLPEAELVVSAGRGMKGPENWGIIEALANELGATTACSRPVADTGWRPHHEHVGQTGVAIKPNLYIAAGISGAIQHLAGVNNSKTIVVINKDPEAPFFKAADYGICADLFDVVPALTEALKRYKQSN